MTTPTRPWRDRLFLWLCGACQDCGYLMLFEAYLPYFGTRGGYCASCGKLGRRPPEYPHRSLFGRYR